MSKLGQQVKWIHWKKEKRNKKEQQDLKNTFPYYIRDFTALSVFIL